MSREKTLDNIANNKVTIGDVAYEVKIRIDNPSDSGYERFVGLKHFDSGSLEIRRWGSTSNIISSMKVFKKGDFLFSRRRVYLKKASLATFNGVCSGDAFVLRQKPDILVPNFLPLILNTDRLWDYAITHSSGSMSTRVKWRDLAKYEFHFPSRKEQLRISNIIWTIEKSIGRVEEVITKTQRLKKALMKELFTSGIGPMEYKETVFGEIPKSWEIKQIKDVCEVNKKNVNPKREPQKKINYIDISSIANYDIVRVSEFFGHNSPSRARRVVSYNDILVSTVRPYLRAFTKVPKEYDDYVCSTGFAVLTPKNDINPKFLFQFVKSDYFVNSLQRFMVGSSYPAVTQKDVEIVKIVLPPLEEQHSIAEVLSRMDENLVLLGTHREILVSLKKRLLNDLIK